MPTENNHIKTIPLTLESDRSEEALNFYSFINEEHLEKFKHIKFKGDRVFNFSKEKVKLFNSIVEKENQYKLAVNKLKKLNSLAVNCSILCTTGNMNNSKANQRIVYRDSTSGKITGDPVSNPGSPLDRSDRFIYLLNEYYTKGDLSVFSHTTNGNLNNLDGYLTSVSSVYIYCKEIYNLENEEGFPDIDFIDKIIKTGNIALNNSKNIYLYISLAVDFWNYRIRYIKRQIKKRNNFEFNEVPEIKLNDIITEI